jgi:3-oxoacyl-[acyl-carrier protein] reductase
VASYPELKSKRVLITGANSGIGLAQAREFLNQGAKVTGFDRNVDQMQDLKEAFASDFDYYQLDLTDVELLKATIGKLVSIDVLLNTAGILDEYRPIESTSFDLWQKILDTNVTTMFNVTKNVLPLLAENGIIVNMASIAGMVAGGGGIAYTTAKHAVIGFTKQLALDCAERGIRVNGIAPGCIETPMNAKDFENGGEMAKSVAKDVPIKRWAGAEEVASVSAFLASDSASYLQGTIIPVDGGWIIK